MASSEERMACDRCRAPRRDGDGRPLRCSRCLASHGGRSGADAASPATDASTPVTVTADLDSVDAASPVGWDTKPSTPACTDPDLDLSDADDDAAAEAKAEPESPATPRSRAAAKKKRMRLCLSCVRCHRLKVKCDKAVPCGRCVRGNLDGECTYTHKRPLKRDESLLQSPAAPFASVGEKTTRGVYDAWESVRRGDSHWRMLLAELSKLCPRPFVPRAIAHGECSSHKSALRPVLSTHFPFYSPPTGPKESLLAVIPARPVVDRLVASYLEIYEQVTRVVHGPSLRDEIAAYFDSPSAVDMSWLSQFCMILGLGYLASRSEPKALREDRARELFETAASCLASTPYLFRPNIAALRAMCLMVTARLVAATACWDNDSSWPLVGMIVRLAILRGYHRDDGEHSPFDREMRRRLWTTIVYLDIQLSMASGMPPQIRVEDFTAQCPANVNDEDLSPANRGPIVPRMFEVTEASPQILIQHSLPVVLEIVHKLNSPGAVKMTYEEVLAYNARIRAQMQHASALKCPELPHMALDIYFRRTLLALHRRYAAHPDALHKYPVSYWASLEGSLALLVHHRALCEETLPAAVSKPPAGDNGKAQGRRRKAEAPGVSVVDASAVAGMFVMDFYAASLTACVHLLRPDSRFGPGIEEEPGSFAIPPRKTIVETLRYCLEIWTEVAERSACYQTRLRWLDVALKSVGDAAD